MSRTLTRFGRTRVAALGCALLTAAVACVASHPAPASAAPAVASPETAPGSPGTPQPPTPVFTEDFENRQSALPIRLDDYTGTAGTTYTADPAWLVNCNGWIAAFDDPPGSDPSVAPQVRDCTPATGGPGTPGVTAWNRVRQLSRAIGDLNGSAVPSANHAVSAYTNGSVNSGNPGPDKVEFQTENPVPVTANGRFLTFSVNAAETSCDANHNHALLNYYLVDGTTSIPVTNRPIDPCTSGTEVEPGYFAGTFTGDAPLLFTGTEVGIKMINGQGSGNGNDHSFDDIRLLDVTPQLDKSFDPDRTGVGGSSLLTFTITNTDDLLAKDGWSFTDTLPPGLTLTTPADASTDCPAGTVSADDGGSTISLTGGALSAGQASCTVTARVTSSTAGTYTNDGSNITDSTGVNPPGSADVTFVPPAQGGIGLTKSATPSSFSAAGQVIRYTYHVTNTGDVPLTSVDVVDELAGVSDVSCPRSTLEPGESQDCTATYTITQDDVDRGSVTNVATAQGVPPGATEPLVSAPAEVTVRAVAKPAITIRKSVDPTTYGEVGQLLHYRYQVTNTGNVRLDRITVPDHRPGVSTVRCPQTTLAPGKAMTCTATYRITAADLRAQYVRNSARAQGYPPGSRTPVRSAPSAATAYAQVPVTG